MKIAIAQIAPVFLDRARTLAKVAAHVAEAADHGATLVCFSEILAPGYPVWLECTGGAAFNDDDQKRLHARYLDQGVDIDDGHLDEVRTLARQRGLAIVVGIGERPRDRGGHTLYCSRVMIGADGAILSVHRKLVPTHQERLVWGAGDGAGLVTHRIGEFTVGALNCWENWMPLARHALYGAGEDLHIALWPGSRRNTVGSTPFIAFESRSYVVSVGGLLRDVDIPEDVPLRAQFVAPGETICDGGSALADPSGAWIIEPVVDQEVILYAELDPARVRAERQNFDPVGHYARPDVFSVRVDRRRQRAVEFDDD